MAALEAAAAGTAVVVTEQTDIPGIAASGVASWSCSIRPRSGALSQRLRAHEWESSLQRTSECSTRESRSLSASRSIPGGPGESVTDPALAVQSQPSRPDRPPVPRYASFVVRAFDTLVIPIHHAQRVGTSVEPCCKRRRLCCVSAL